MLLSKVLVTGAGGFIGGAVAHALAGRPGVTVVGATRDGRALGGGIAPGRLDVRDRSSVAAALEGVGGVVHCAAGDRATTVDGTGVLLDAARQAGVGRVVHVSSVAVYGGAQGPVDEMAAVLPVSGRGYAHWKAAAEQLCRDAAQGGPEIVIVRPAIVYGPGSRLWITLPARRLVSGAWRGLGEAGRGTCNPVHVRDVAAACVAGLTTPGVAGGEAFNVSGADGLSWGAWYARLAQALGLPALRDLPAAGWRRRAWAALAVKALARKLPAAGRVFERVILGAPARSELTLFALAATYPIGKAAARLHWEPRIGLEAGLAESVAWLRASGLAGAG